MAYKSERERGALPFLYGTKVGRMLLRPLTSRLVSKAAGRFLSSRMSVILIGPFVNKNGIDLSEYEKRPFKSFNDFFTRRILPEKRPVDMRADALIAPCDGRLSAYRIDAKSVFPVKNSLYSVKDLLGGDEKAGLFRDGICLVFRLCVDDYHRYHFFDGGTVTKSRFIDGVLHTVRPIALEHTDVFIQNAREYGFIDTDHFGLAAYVEVGALLVGKIANRPVTGRAERGEEKGLFLYGGSTVIVLLQKDTADIPDEIFRATEEERETRVKMGSAIGRARQ